MFSFLHKALQKTYTQVTSKLQVLFGKDTIDEESLAELEKILISADTGIHTTRSIIDQLKKQRGMGALRKGADLEGALALWLKGQGKKVLLVAADTFRAAAQEQLLAWAQKLDIPLVRGKENQDPASVIFQGCNEFKAGGYDALIIDTTGRLQTKTHLMNELEKISKILSKQLDTKKIITLLTVDAMLGQNSFDQAKVFHESTHIDGIVLTKMDGTGKGGIVFAITEALSIPLAFISFGEQAHQMALFNPDEYVRTLLG